MPATVDDLIRNKPKPVVVTIDAMVDDALAHMLKEGYSQMPVVDADQKPIGLITVDSIVRASHTLKIKTNDLRVKDAVLKKPAEFYASDDLFELLDDLEKSDTVFVIDVKGSLIGIVTTYDTTAYLRQRSQDIMFVRDIEEMIKSYINAAFTNADGEVDETLQREAIADITPSDKEQRKKFNKAVAHYLKAVEDTKPRLVQTAIDAAFDANLNEQTSIRAFDRLSLNEYIDLLLHNKRWETYEKVFTIDRDYLRGLLDRVRITRNALAHFRDDISPTQRDELLFCKDWLARHETDIQQAFGLHDSAPTSTLTPGTTTASPPDGRMIKEEAASYQTLPPVYDATTPDDDLDTDEGRYIPLIDHLQSRSVDEEKITLTFDDINQLLGEHRLPDSAYKHRAWWANDAKGHSHSQKWLSAGWRVSNVNMTEKRVVFVRTKEHEQQYMEFFGALHDELQSALPTSHQLAYVDGQSWLMVGRLFSENKAIASVYTAFTRTRRFRIELLIDTGKPEVTKHIYDLLHQRRSDIEKQFGEPLSWERLDNQQSARIARYYPGTIMDKPGMLANLRARTVESMSRFYPLMEQQISEVVPSALQKARAHGE